MSKQQKKQKHSNTQGIADKVRLSLVVKINLRMLLRTLWALLAMDVLLCVLLFFITAGNAERGAVDLMKSLDNTITYTAVDAPPGYTVKKTDGEGKGIQVIGFINMFSPLRDYDTARTMTFSDEKNRLESLKYHIVFRGKGYTITYAIGEDFVRYRTMLLILGIFELLHVLCSIGSGRRFIRKALRPLSEMAEHARNQTPIATDSAAEMQRMRELAGAISNIDATKLDERIDLAGTQNELKELASAINNMLNRIDEAYRSQVRFVSDASHELRTPISVIQGYANLLDRWGKNDERTMQESIDAIKSEAQSMKELIEQLLFLARGDNETMQLNVETFDAAEMVEEIMRETQMIDPSHAFRANAVTSAFIKADRQLMKQATRILVDNSIKYTPTGGEIVISVTAAEERVRIMVQDNGIGIEAEDLPHIFDRFYRSDESRARKTGGSGLGLAIMKWIVDRHGGYVEVISRKDIGTRTTIVLPQEKAAVLVQGQNA